MQGRWWSGRSPPGCCSTREVPALDLPRGGVSRLVLGGRARAHRALPPSAALALGCVHRRSAARACGSRVAGPSARRLRCTGDPWANPQGRPRRPRLRPRGLDVHPAARGGVALLAPPLRALGAGLRRVARRPGRHAGRDRDPRRCRGQRRARARPALRPPLVDSGRRCARAARRRLRAPAASRGRAAVQPLRAAARSCSRRANRAARRSGRRPRGPGRRGGCEPPDDGRERRDHGPRSDAQDRALRHAAGRTLHAGRDRRRRRPRARARGARAHLEGRGLVRALRRTGRGPRRVGGQAPRRSGRSARGPRSSRSCCSSRSPSSLAALPAQNALSRRYEAEADWLALVATADPGAATGLVHGLSVASLGDPDPPGWSRSSWERTRRPSTASRWRWPTRNRPAASVGRAASGLGEVADALAGRPLRPAVLHGVHELAHELR